MFTGLAFGQVGIGTTSPAGGSQLDIDGSDKGLLIPRLNIRDLSTIEPVTGGSTESLLAYNTNTFTGKGFYYWNGTEWVMIQDQNNSASGDFIAVKYINNSTSQNLSTDAYTPIKIFGTLVWNDDTAAFNVLSNSTLQVTETGRIRVTANLGLMMDDDVGLQVRINVNGTDVGSSFVASRVDNDDTPRSLFISETILVNANDIISLRGRRTTDSGSRKDIFLMSDSDSFVEVVKLN